ncbi:thiamine biosynthesis protein ThiS [Halobacteroides halobius DSM 5150]|uniref:Thiamine biosynthesis protein ThiS n=1 Tax=Halobacteroides halobius (strain ATCC 35273 / DSM 5150 / MD-1) TaxID=748449 RepID=L0K8A3_HALHC|nr:sulfur carrier protein ThiS [Halobacteroides halobius]AGB41251.1 thiamine biosynthesis protein ThiS [Halobacteroides halobius DSM 5150]
MKVILNGAEEKLEEEIALLDFLTTKELELERLVIEYNQEVIQQEEWANVTLKNGDQLEILRFVGGG